MDNLQRSWNSMGMVIKTIICGGEGKGQEEEEGESQIYQMNNQINQSEIQKAILVDKTTQTDPIIQTQENRRPIIQGHHLFLFIILLIFGYVLLSDIQAKLNTQQSQLEFRRRKCLTDYEEQKCQRGFPAQKEYCSKLQNCIDIDWEVQRGIELSGIIGDMLNNFVEKLNFRTYLLIIVPILVLCLRYI